jgi:hypothetical protein
VLSAVVSAVASAEAGIAAVRVLFVPVVLGYGSTDLQRSLVKAVVYDGSLPHALTVSVSVPAHTCGKKPAEGITEAA